MEDLLYPREGMPTDLAQTIEGKLLEGRYQLVDEIASGQIATVFRGRDLNTGRTVAVKILHARLADDPQVVERFHQEAQSAAVLPAHPNLVSVYATGREGDLHYVVMELVEGASLKGLIQYYTGKKVREHEGAPFSVERALSIATDIISALDFAHRHGLVHGDVKPQNVLISAEGSVKLTDFGMSSGTRTLARGPGSSTTAHYLSPEQARGEAGSEASDVYCLALILFEMLTGQPPFAGDSPKVIAMKHVGSVPVPPSRLNPAVPAIVDAAILRALSKSPRHRYASVAEFRRALMGDESVAAPSSVPAPSVSVTAGRRGRSPGRPILAVVTALVLIGVTALGAWTAYHRVASALASPNVGGTTGTVGKHSTRHHVSHGTGKGHPGGSGIVRKPGHIHLVHVALSSFYLRPGASVEIRYTVRSTESRHVRAGLHASLLWGRGVAPLADRTHYKVIRVRPGLHVYTRRFVVPRTAWAGPYDLGVRIANPYWHHELGHIRLHHKIYIGAA